MSETTDDPEEWKEQWSDYIQQLNTAKLTLPPEQHEEFDEAMETLEDLVLNADLEEDENDS